MHGIDARFIDVIQPCQSHAIFRLAAEGGDILKACQ